MESAGRERQNLTLQPGDHLKESLYFIIARGYHMMNTVAVWNFGLGEPEKASCYVPEAL